jgi:hypothetical protein
MACIIYIEMKKRVQIKGKKYYNNVQKWVAFFFFFFGRTDYEQQKTFQKKNTS